MRTPESLTSSALNQNAMVQESLPLKKPRSGKETDELEPSNSYAAATEPATTETS
jgi:hypothetical protein